MTNAAMLYPKETKKKKMSLTTIVLHLGRVHFAECLVPKFNPSTLQ